MNYKKNLAYETDYFRVIAENDELKVYVIKDSYTMSVRPRSSNTIVLTPFCTITGTDRSLDEDEVQLKEVEKIKIAAKGMKEFTRSDILEFGFFIENTICDEECVLATKFHDWLKQRGKQ